MRRQFKDTLLQLAEIDPRIVLVFGDISVFLFKDFQDRYPDRFYNLGICEQALISVCAGLRSQGFIPFAHSICPFITERCYEQIKLDCVYNDFPVNIVSCGASFDYAWDGPSHQTTNELAMLRNLPGIEICQPGAPAEFDTLLRSQYANPKTTYFRLSDHNHGHSFPIEFGKAEVVQDRGAALTVMTAGPLLKTVAAACAEEPVNLVYFHTLKPIDRAVIERFRHTRLLFVQDAYGLGEAVHEIPGLTSSRHGPPDEFTLTYGTSDQIRTHLGLDVAGVRAAIEKELAVCAS